MCSKKEIFGALKTGRRPYRSGWGTLFVLVCFFVFQAEATPVAPSAETHASPKVMTVPAPKPTVVKSPFEQWLTKFRAKAISEGVSEKFFDETVGRIKPLAHVIEKDRKQPEFVTDFWSYTDRRLTPERIEDGRRFLKEHQALLTKMRERYHVPEHYILSFWGLETNYGRYKGKTDILNALATLAFDNRRSAFFTRELINLLKIMEKEKIDRLTGSWAGAFGHFQFMPSTFLAYAVDGDDDGRIDLVNSLPDAFASAANFLSSLGWNERLKWGREVVLSKNPDWARMALPEPITVGEWMKMGVAPADGEAFFDSDQDIYADLLLPMGVKGPAFLVYKNFKIMMLWNRSELYALTVGLLADRISGRSARLVHQERQKPLSFAAAQEIQKYLARLGYYDGPIDGHLGRASKQAIVSFQKAYHLPADGYADDEFLFFIKQQGN